MKFLILTYQNAYASGTPTLTRFAKVDAKTKLYTYKCQTGDDTICDLYRGFSYQSKTVLEAAISSKVEIEQFITKFNQQLDCLSHQTDSILGKADYDLIAMKALNEIKKESAMQRKSTVNFLSTMNSKQVKQEGENADKLSLPYKNF